MGYLPIANRPSIKESNKIMNINLKNKHMQLHLQIEYKCRLLIIMISQDKIKTLKILWLIILTLLLINHHLKEIKIWIFTHFHKQWIKMKNNKIICFQKFPANLLKFILWLIQLKEREILLIIQLIEQQYKTLKKIEVEILWQKDLALDLIKIEINPKL